MNSIQYREDGEDFIVIDSASTRFQLSWNKVDTESVTLGDLISRRSNCQTKSILVRWSHKWKKWLSPSDIDIECILKLTVLSLSHSLSLSLSQHTRTHTYIYIYIYIYILWQMIVGVVVLPRKKAKIVHRKWKYKKKKKEIEKKNSKQIFVYLDIFVSVDNWERKIKTNKLINIKEITSEI